MLQSPEEASTAAGSSTLADFSHAIVCEDNRVNNDLFINHSRYLDSNLDLSFEKNVR